MERLAAATAARAAVGLRAWRLRSLACGGGAITCSSRRRSAPATPAGAVAVAQGPFRCPRRSHRRGMAQRSQMGPGKGRYRFSASTVRAGRRLWQRLLRAAHGGGRRRIRARDRSHVTVCHAISRRHAGHRISASCRIATPIARAAGCAPGIRYDVFHGGAVSPTLTNRSPAPAQGHLAAGRTACSGNHLRAGRRVLRAHTGRPLRAHEKCLAVANDHRAHDLAATHRFPRYRYYRRIRNDHRRAAFDRMDDLRVSRRGPRP